MTTSTSTRLIKYKYKIGNFDGSSERHSLETSNTKEKKQAVSKEIME